MQTQYCCDIGRGATDERVQAWRRALEQSEALLATPCWKTLERRCQKETLVAMASLAGTDESIGAIAAAIATIVGSDDGRRELATADVRDALLTLGRAATSDRV